MLLLLVGCMLDDLRADVARLEEQVATLEAENEALRAEVDACGSLKELEASASRNFDPPSERCEADAFAGDPALLSATGMARDVRLLPGADGVRVIGIRRGSFAESCGFHNGDVITAVNGVAVSSVEDWVAPEGSEVRFSALRRKEPVTWTLALD